MRCHLFVWILGLLATGLLSNAALAQVSPGPPEFIRGDCNNDGPVNIADAIAMLDGLFSGVVVSCLDACDSNNDGGYDIADAIYVLSFLFDDGPEPSAPYPECGVAEQLGCDFSAACFSVVPPALPVRINCGGPELPALDGGPVWQADSSTAPSPYNVGDNLGSPSFQTFLNAIPDGTVPPEVPGSIFSKERFYQNVPGTKLWEIPVEAPGDYEVRLYFAENFHSISGIRRFDVHAGMGPVGGLPLFLDDFDIVEAVGFEVGTMRSINISITDAAEPIRIQFFHGIENPLICGIEVLEATVSK